MTTPPMGGGAEILIVELEAHEVATGAAKVVTLPSGRSISVQVPAGVAHDTVLHLLGPETNDPFTPRELLLRVQIKPTGVQPESPFSPAPFSPAPFSAPPAPYSAPPNPFLPPAMGPGQTGALPPTDTIGWPPVGVGQALPPKKAGNGRLILIGAAVVAVLACCGGVIAIARPFAARQAGADASDGTTAPTPTASPVPTPLAAPDYQALLASVDAAINPPMQQLIAAHTMAEVRTGAAGLAAATQSGYAKLTAATPPTAAATAHQNVVRAFSQFQDIAEDTASATRSGAVCSASAAVPKLTNSPGATALRAAATELAAVDPASPFKIGFWLPAATPEQSRRLANGAFVKKGTRNGSGQLKIDNTGGSKDVSMSLATAGAKTTAFAVYVRAGSSYTVTGVKDGTYDIYMTSGTDWDPVGPGFSRDCGFSKFDDPLAFKTTNSQYTIWTLTLKASAAGNASTAEVNPDEFPQ